MERKYSKYINPELISQKFLLEDIFSLFCFGVKNFLCLPKLYALGDVLDRNHEVLDHPLVLQAVAGVYLLLHRF
jgi:hypothetical protein